MILVPRISLPAQAAVEDSSGFALLNVLADGLPLAAATAAGMIAMARKLPSRFSRRAIAFAPRASIQLGVALRREAMLLSRFGNTCPTRSVRPHAAKRPSE